MPLLIAYVVGFGGIAVVLKARETWHLFIGAAAILYAAFVIAIETGLNGLIK